MKISYCIYQAFIIIILFSCNKKTPLFIQLNKEQTGIDFTNHVADNEKLNILTYPYLFNGAGVAIADFNNDGWQDIFFAGNHKGTNKLYINKHNFKFEDKTAKAGVAGKSDWCTGISTVDINGDGWMDIYISTVTIPGLLNSTNELYINNHDGSFTEAAKQYGLDFKGHTTQAVFFDYDKDGDLDCFLLNHSVTYEDDYKTVADRKFIDPYSGNKLLRNDNGHFVDVTTSSGMYSSKLAYGLGVAVGDLNNDGFPDIYVSNDFKENDYCYMNNGNGTFTESIENLFGHTSRFSMGNDIADYNNDGWLDVMTLDMLSQDEKVLKSSVADDDIEIYNYKQHFGFHYQFSKNCLQENLSGKYFADKSLQLGVAATDWSWAPLFADFNNDGYKDLYISNGFTHRTNDLDFNNFVQDAVIKNQRLNIATDKLALVKQIPGGAVPDYFYLNEKGNGFTDVSAEANFTTPTLSNGAAYGDLNNDGELDLIVNRMNEPSVIYENNMPAHNFLQVQLKGTKLNTNGIGATVYVFTKNNMQMLQQNTVHGFMSSVSPLLHFGLNTAGSIDSVIVIWSSGKEQRLTGIAVNKKIILNEADTSANISRPASENYFDDNWKDETNQSSNINFIHKEDAFDDLAKQPLLPHSLATQGPALATADVNGDGLQDFYVGGAKNESGVLYLQNNNGAFTQSPQQVFKNDSAYEDINAIFFDADNDGDKDLYITSGGNEYYGHNDLLNDRLYINDGKGNFTRKALTPLYENKSCVAACDFDKDGDMDLFVGGRANARMYGYTPASVILQNDGKGNFTEVTEKVADGLINAGMVTDACWADIDNDGWKDLILVGEWMPVTVFKNNKGKLEKENIPSLNKTNGWWNCIYATDIDGNGNEDFLLGNWGTNSKLKATEKNPLMLYLNDWDKSGETNPILSIEKSNNYYTFLSKGDLEKRLPYIKKQFLKYGDAAGKTTAEIFGEDAIEKSRKMQAYTMQTSVLWNDKGKLKLEALPSFLQSAPVFAFASYKNKNGKQTYIASGNFYEVSPYEGRYDAMLPTEFEFINQQAVLTNYILEKGCVRKMQCIPSSNNKQILLMVKNNDTLKIFSKENIQTIK